jgi:hypothetical protein
VPGSTRTGPSRASTTQPVTEQPTAARLDSFARIPLLFGPSPVHRLGRLSEHLGGEVEIWAKREDCNAGLAYGGNKTRKLEYLVAEALAQGCDTLVSIGGVQSNHAAGRCGCGEARPRLCPCAGALG